VALIDPSPKAPWRNNYGVWVDEFEALGHGDCFTKAWPLARVLLTADKPEGLPLDRAYAQVDRAKLKAKLLRAAVAAGVEFYSGKVDAVRHPEDELPAPGAEGDAAAAAAAVRHPTLSTVAVRGRGDAPPLHARAVLDATGHARRLVRFDAGFTPGYQAAYGILAEVERHPFPLNEMLFMDWRCAQRCGGSCVRCARERMRLRSCADADSRALRARRSDEHLDPASKARRMATSAL
jgi:lycopene beta-cyclase